MGASDRSEWAPSMAGHPASIPAGKTGQAGKGLPGWYPPVCQLAGQVRVVGNRHLAALPPQVQRLVEDERHGDAGCRPAGRAEELHGPLGVRDDLAAEALLVLLKLLPEVHPRRGTVGKLEDLTVADEQVTSGMPGEHVNLPRRTRDADGGLDG